MHTQRERESNVNYPLTSNSTVESIHILLGVTKWARVRKKTSRPKRTRKESGSSSGKKEKRKEREKEDDEERVKRPTKIKALTMMDGQNSDDDGGYNSDDVPNRMDARTPNPLALENFNLSPEVVCALQKKGIDALFAIQAQTLDTAMSGKDIVGRARTGCGKTLAFVLPIVEQINKTDPTSRPEGGYKDEGQWYAFCARRESWRNKLVQISIGSDRLLI